MRRTPWHSIHDPVFHDRTDCRSGNDITSVDIRLGEGGKAICPECQRLALEDSQPSSAGRAAPSWPTGQRSGDGSGRG